MTFADYQKKSRRTAKYPEIGHKVIYPALGLAGESGEVLNKIKKIFRDDEGQLTQQMREDVKKELGDLLWYMAQICTELGISFDDVAQGNLDKLLSRQKRGALGGSGDNR